MFTSYRTCADLARDEAEGGQARIPGRTLYPVTDSITRQHKGMHSLLRSDYILDKSRLASSLPRDLHGNAHQCREKAQRVSVENGERRSDIAHSHMQILIKFMPLHAASNRLHNYGADLSCAERK